jgi:hypothetical protein
MGRRYQIVMLSLLTVSLVLSIMEYPIESIGVLFAIIFGFLGFLGGVPELKRWLVPRPHLRITILKKSVNYEGKSLHFAYEVENKRNPFTRNADATDLVMEISEIDSNHIQWDKEPTKLPLSKCLLVGAKYHDDRGNIRFNYYRTPTIESNYPFTIFLKVSCTEGSIDTKKIIIEKEL